MCVLGKHRICFLLLLKRIPANPLPSRGGREPSKCALLHCNGDVGKAVLLLRGFISLHLSASRELLGLWPSIVKAILVPLLHRLRSLTVRKAPIPLGQLGRSPRFSLP